MKIAVVKPDHVGDLVLSLAAIRAMLAQQHDVTLFVSSANLGLARVLLGSNADIRPIDFPHLSKTAKANEADIDLSVYDLVVFLRHDNILAPAWAELRCRDYVFPVDSHDHHQSMIDYGVVAPLIGAYDPDLLQFETHLDILERKGSSAPRTVGLCVGSGFHANIWPFAHWVTLGKHLLAAGQDVHVICGPSEPGIGTALTQQLALATNRLIMGGASVSDFLDRVGAMDWVVASDGGTAHLCSLRAPVLSIFGPSPFRRYAPFGRWNRLLTRDLSCSPCCQWASRLVNGCLSMECMALINTADVAAALHAQDDHVVSPSRRTLRFDGISHAAIGLKCAERDTASPMLLGKGQRNAPNETDFRTKHAATGIAGKPHTAAANSRVPAPARRRRAS